MLSIAFDREAGFIRAYAEGLFTAEDAARGAIDSQVATAECFEAIGCARVLMIADGTIERVRRQDRRTHTPPEPPRVLELPVDDDRGA